MPTVTVEFDNGETKDLFEGLSPRVRGNPLQHGRAVEDVGSIPACAG
jgi:hypothetical protein